MDLYNPNPLWLWQLKPSKGMMRLFLGGGRRTGVEYYWRDIIHSAGGLSTVVGALFFAPILVLPSPLGSRVI